MLIEIRIGPGKWKLKSIMQDTGAECKVRTCKVPHLSLYGPFNANREELEKIKQSIESVSRSCLYLPFFVDDYEFRKSPKGKGWIFAFKIKPSESLKKLRSRLSKKLSKVVPSAQPWDNNVSSFWFHVSLALNLRKSEVKQVWAFLHNGNHSVLDRLLNFIGLRKKEEKRFCLPMNGLRITLLSDEKRIICEYDLPQKRWLSRNEALDRSEWKRTLRVFRLMVLS